MNKESSDGVVEMQMIEGMLKSWYRTGNYDVIRDFISSILAVISVLVILVGTYISLSEIKKHR